MKYIENFKIEAWRKYINSSRDVIVKSRIFGTPAGLYTIISRQFFIQSFLCVSHAKKSTERKALNVCVE